MNKQERLMSYYDGELKFIYDESMPAGLSGLIIENTVYLNKNLSHEELVATIAEEIGHYKTSPQIDITDYNNLRNRKSEHIARKWSYKYLVPFHQLKSFVKNKEAVYDYELAEEFEVPKEIIEEAVNMYRVDGKL